MTHNINALIILVLLVCIGHTRAVSAYNIQPLYQTSTALYQSTNLYRTANRSTSRLWETSSAFSCYGAITYASTVSSGTRVQVYAPFSNEMPSAAAPVIRRVSAFDNDDDDLPTKPSINPNDPGEMAPIGSEWVLLLFALAYIVLSYKKQTFKSRAL